jgi:GT2 family glycosyltransferase
MSSESPSLEPASSENSSSDAPDLSILVVCYKSLDLIGPTLYGVFERTEGCSFEVLLTDCSDDGTIEWVAKHYPEVRLIPTDQNLGFAAGNNFLAPHARGKRLLLLNPDVIVYDNAIGELYACSEELPEAGAWGGQTILPEGKIDPGAQQSTPTLGRLMLAAIGQEQRTIGGLSEDATGPQSVEGLSGAFLMIDRSRWDAMGGFDTGFFMYAEELDLCFRLRQAGHPLYMTPKAKITHLVGGGTAISPGRATSIARAKMHFLRKHRGQLVATAGGGLFWLAAVNRWLLSLVKKDQRAQLVGTASAAVARNPLAWWFGYPRTATSSSTPVQTTPSTAPNQGEPNQGEPNQGESDQRESGQRESSQP